MPNDSYQNATSYREANERRMQLQQELLDEATHLLIKKCQVPLVTTEQESKDSGCNLKVH